MTLAPALLLFMPLLLGLVTFVTGMSLEPFPGKDDVWRLPRRLPQRPQMQDSPHGALLLRHS